MESSVWRPRTKIVVLIDIVVVCAYFLWTVFQFVRLGHLALLIHVLFGASEKWRKLQDERRQLPAMMDVLTVVGFYALFIVTNVISLWFAVTLLRATKILYILLDREPEKAGKRSEYYRAASLWLLICVEEAASVTNEGLGVLTGIVIAWRCVTLLTVSMFIYELRSVVASKENATADV